MWLTDILLEEKKIFPTPDSYNKKKEKNYI